MRTMLRRGDFAVVPKLGYKQWRAILRSVAAWYSPEVMDPKAFAEGLRVRSICGLVALDLDHNAQRTERTQRDVRLDDVGIYHAVFQVVGRSTVLQNDQAVTLDVGDVALVDSSRPVTYAMMHTHGGLPLQLPRGSLMSHLGLGTAGWLYRPRNARRTPSLPTCPGWVNHYI
jgi:AraC family transcriptional activator of tynA and feaB